MIAFPISFPQIKTERLLLRALNHSDAAVIFRLYGMKEVMEFRGESCFTEMTEAEKLIFHWRKLFGTENGIRWGIEFRQTGKLIGTLGFKQISQVHLRADLGYELDPQWWNRGIMTEAVKAVTDYGFEKLNLHSVKANITPGHIASQRVLEKMGFRNEAHFRENYFYEGWWDSGIWSLMR